MLPAPPAPTALERRVLAHRPKVKRVEPGVARPAHVHHIVADAAVHDRRQHLRRVGRGGGGMSKHGSACADGLHAPCRCPRAPPAPAQDGRGGEGHGKVNLSQRPPPTSALQHLLRMGEGVEAKARPGSRLHVGVGSGVRVGVRGWGWGQGLCGCGPSLWRGGRLAGCRCSAGCKCSARKLALCEVRKVVRASRQWRACWLSCQPSATLHKLAVKSMLAQLKSTCDPLQADHGDQDG